MNEPLKCPKCSCYVTDCRCHMSTIRRLEAERDELKAEVARLKAEIKMLDVMVARGAKALLRAESAGADNKRLREELSTCHVYAKQIRESRDAEIARLLEPLKRLEIATRCPDGGRMHTTEAENLLEELFVLLPT